MSKYKELLANLGLDKKDTSSDKDLKKLLNSYIGVLQHKLGRVPTTEELLAHMSENEGLQKSDEEPTETMAAPTQDAAIRMIKEHTQVPQPSFLDLKVFHGRADGKPDISKVLYYEHPNGLVYDTHEGSWLFNRPEVLNHLDSRPLLHDDHDLMQAIMHGMVDQHDFDQLNERGLVTGPVQRMWELSQDLKRQYEELHSHKMEILSHEELHNSNKETVNHLLDIIHDLSEENQYLKSKLEEMSPEYSFGDEIDGPDLTDDSIMMEGFEPAGANGGELPSTDGQ